MENNLRDSRQEKNYKHLFTLLCNFLLNIILGVGQEILMIFSLKWNISLGVESHMYRFS